MGYDTSTGVEQLAQMDYNGNITYISSSGGTTSTGTSGTSGTSGENGQSGSSGTSGKTGTGSILSR